MNVAIAIFELSLILAILLFSNFLLFPLDFFLLFLRLVNIVLLDSKSENINLLIIEEEFELLS